MRRALLISIGGVGTLAVLTFVAWSGPAQHGNAAAADMLLRLENSHFKPPLPDVVLLAIDDETVRRWGQLPIDRAVIARALDRVADAAPSMLVVDMLLSERTTARADAALAGTFGRFPCVVLASALDVPTNGGPSKWIEPLREFEDHAYALGHVHIEPDPDGVARSLLLAKSTADRRYWALGFEAFRALMATQAPPFESTRELQVGTHRIPATHFNQRLLWIHYAGPEGTFPRVSLAQVLDHKVPASKFDGKVVILGVTAQGAGDRIFTPFSAGLGMSGIEVHANVLHTLANNAFLVPLSPLMELLSVFTMAGVVTAAWWWRHGRFLIPVAVIGLVLIPGSAYLLFSAKIIVPVASWMMTYVAALLMALLLNTLSVRRLLHQAIVGQQDYAFRLQAVAHEIKTPLTAIHASSQLMAEVAIPESKKEEIAHHIHAEAGRLSGVVTTFLDVERIAAGVLKLRRQPVDLAELAAHVIEHVALPAMKKNIRIEHDLPPVTLPADAELLEFAIYNLLVNAIKYSAEATSVQVSLRSDRRTARLEVSDQGFGIEPAEQKHIFEKFYRAKQRGGEEPGSGVGLAMVREIVTQHGGRVEVTSVPGKGSTFSVYLPIEVKE